jgi:hypothetical protein
LANSTEIFGDRQIIKYDKKTMNEVGDLLLAHIKLSAHLKLDNYECWLVVIIVRPMDESLQAKRHGFVGDKLPSEWKDLLQEFLRSHSIDAMAVKLKFKPAQP